MKNTARLTVFGALLFSAATCAETTVRLVVSAVDDSSVKASPHVAPKAYSKTNKTKTPSVCVGTPDGANQWCLRDPHSGTAKSQSAVSVGTPSQVITLPAYGYEAREVAAYLSASGQFGLVEADVATFTPRAMPVQNLNTDNLAFSYDANDPAMAQQSRYFGSSSDSPVGMNVLAAWQKYDVQHVNNPLDVIVMDSTFITNRDVKYSDGRSFTTKPFEDGADRIPRSDDYRPDPQALASGECSPHGLAVAGTIGATINNKLAAAGVTNNIRLHAIRTLNCGEGWLSDTADALHWLAGTHFNGVSPYQGKPGVVNLSLGGSTSYCPTYLQRGIDAAVNAGFNLVVSAGNSSEPAANASPANCENVITVAALDQYGSLSSFSNYGEHVDIAALGSRVVAACDENDTPCYWSGTSFSAPLVAGGMALAKQISSADNLTLNAILTLTANADNLGRNCADGQCGSGVIDTLQLAETAIAAKQNGFNQIEFALSDGTSCEQSWFVEHFGARIPLCELYEITFMDGRNHPDISYQLVSIPLWSAWNKAQAIPEGTYTDGVARISKLQIDTRRYGFKLCDAHRCDDQIIELDTHLAQEQYRPAGCPK